MKASTLGVFNAARKSMSAQGVRAFSTTRAELDKLRVGYVPVPLHYAYEKFGLSEHADLQSFPAGTGTMIDAFHANEIDVGIGLTEAWVVGLSNSTATQNPYHIVGAYTMSPLLWAISTGGLRADIQYVEELKGLKPGISRFGSGSHIMASVLAQTHDWLQASGEAPFDFVECGPFEELRSAVNHGQADFFLWEHFTSKRYYDDGTLKRVGEIETPWNAWHIAAKGAKADPRIAEHLLPALEKGIKKFEDSKEEAVDYITQHLPYSAEDAQAWYSTVKFAGKNDLRSLTTGSIEKALEMLKISKVLGERQIGSVKELGASDAERYS